MRAAIWRQVAHLNGQFAIIPQSNRNRQQRVVQSIKLRIVDCLLQFSLRTRSAEQLRDTAPSIEIRWHVLLVVEIPPSLVFAVVPSCRILATRYRDVAEVVRREREEERRLLRALFLPQLLDDNRRTDRDPTSGDHQNQ